MIILASGSPRRKELLQAAGFTFKTVNSGYIETLPLNLSLSPAETALYFAEKKAETAGRFAEPGDIIIGADTVVTLDGEVLGKPRDKADAVRMLRMLSGSKHSVITGVCLIKFSENGEKRFSFSETTEVEFYPLTEEEISEYVNSGEPMDKAGAYGIQEKGDLFVKRIDGDFFNVVGLPVARLSREIKNI